MSASLFAKAAFGGALVGLGAFAALGSGGCAGKESLSPTDTATVPVDAGPTSVPPDAEPPPTPVRQILSRNPLGGPPKNLFADGDFELSIITDDQVGGQFGWLGFAADSSRISIPSETGGICRSGLRCAHAKKGAILYGRGTSAPGEARMDATIWVKPYGADASPDPAKACKNVANAYMISCDAAGIVATLAPPGGATDDGWCQLYTYVDGSKESVCMYVELKVEALVDAAILLPQPPPAAPLSKSAGSSAGTPSSPFAGGVPTPEQEAKVRALGERIRRETPFAKPVAPIEPQR